MKNQNLNMTKETLNKVILKIKEHRLKKGFSHEYLSHELEVSPSTYNKIEQQKTKLSFERFLQLQQILEIPITEFFEVKSNNIYNQDLKDSSVGHQEIENIYQDNKELNNKFIESLKEEIQFLRSQLKLC